MNHRCFFNNALLSLLYVNVICKTTLTDNILYEDRSSTENEPPTFVCLKEDKITQIISSPERLMIRNLTDMHDVTRIICNSNQSYSLTMNSSLSKIYSNF